MKNIFLGKCRAERIPLKDRWDRGARDIEIHLNDSEPEDMAAVEIMTQHIINSNLRALVIHSPMKQTFIVEAFGNEEAYERMKLVSQLAQNMHNVHGQPVIVVVHQELSLQQLIDYGLIDRITISLAKLLLMYPDVKYAFENSTLITLEEGAWRARLNFGDQAPKLAWYMRERIGTNRIGSVLDTCHALCSNTAIGFFKKYETHTQPIEDYFDKFKNTLFLIHLSNASGLGIGKDHGICFTSDEDKILLRKILKKVEDIGYEGPITLELMEDDPNVMAPNYSHTINEIKKITSL